MKNGKRTKPKLVIDKVYRICDGEREYSIISEDVWKHPEVFPILVAKDEAEDYNIEFSDNDSIIVYYKLKDVYDKTKEIYAFEWRQN